MFLKNNKKRRCPNCGSRKYRNVGKIDHNNSVFYCKNCWYRETVNNKELIKKIPLSVEVKRSVRLMIFMAFLMFVFTMAMILVVNDNYQFASSSYLDLKGSVYSNNDKIRLIADYCSLHTTDFKKIDCVHNFVVKSGRFNYSNESRLVVDPDVLLSKGGDCKSWTVFYDSIYQLLGFDTSYVFTDSHVYLNVYGDDFYCNVDQTEMNCLVTEG